ncbi:MAG: DUF2153 family protein [Candidatus Nezhaarchaeales archaeon]
MSAEWSRLNREFLRLMDEVASKRPKDRLDYLNLLNISLHAMAGSIMGWYQRLNDSEALSSLGDDELKEVADRVSSLAREFVKYDIKASRRYSRRGAKTDELESFEDLYGEEELIFEDEEEL